MATPKTMKALVMNDAEDGVVVAEVPIPQPGDNEILVKVDYVAPNPTDWKNIESVAPAGVIMGCDYAGTAVEVPGSVSHQRDHIKVGTRVAGWVLGSQNSERGSFAQYLKVPANLAFPVPDNMKTEEACTFGVPFYTAFMALKVYQNAPWPPAREGSWYLVYGGSSSVGLFTIQVAKMMGYKVITTCSAHNFDLVKSYGADEVVDYKSPQAIEKIKQITGGGVHKGVDCISLPDSIAFSIKCFAEGKGYLSVMLPPDAQATSRPDVEVELVAVYAVWGGFKYGPRGGQKKTYTAEPHYLKFFEDLVERMPEYLELGLKSLPIEKLGGIGDIAQGLEDMKEGKVSGKRYVYRIE